MATTVEINDAYFCSHIKEVVSCPRFLKGSELDYHYQCEDCSYDRREDNDAFYGVSRAPFLPLV